MTGFLRTGMMAADFSAGWDGGQCQREVEGLCEDLGEPVGTGFECLARYSIRASSLPCVS